MKRLLPLAAALAAIAAPLAAQSTDAGAGAEQTAVVEPADLTAEQFVATAAASNAFEIASSQVALDAAGSREDVREFARRMIEEHTAATARLQEAATASGVPAPPPALDDRHQDMVQALTDADQGTLDNAYLEMQLNAHIESVALFSAYAEREDPLGAFAAEMLPSLRMHEEMVRELIAAN